MAESSYDAIVIGAGVIGAAVALSMARRGHRVLALDRLPAVGYGSTSGSCAIVRPFYSTYEGVAMGWECHFYWDGWASYLNAPDPAALTRYIASGNTVIRCSKNKYLNNILKIMDEVGCPYELVSADALRARLPTVSLDSYLPARRPEDPDFGATNGEALSGAVFFPTGGYVTDPQRAARDLLEAAGRAGAEFRFNADVAEILRAGERCAGVRLATGETLRAPVVVNVAGPHSHKVNVMAGVEEGMKIKTRALRHEVAHVPAPRGLEQSKGGTHFSDADTATYCRPESGDHILIGSEDPDCDPREWVDPDDFDRNPTEQSRIQVMRLAQRFPDISIPQRVRTVVDLYDVSDDWLPIYDRSDLDGFYMAVGTSGNQFKTAPLVGEMMAHLIDACETGHDHDAEPVDFHLRHIDRVVNMGFCSRRREINPDSSFSVVG
jgi:sarcosine oxidase subunit beta